MCLNVDANGYGDGEGTHVSVFTYLMRGDNDDHLKWPFKGTIKVTLLNQLEDGQHHTQQLWSPDSDVDENARKRVTEGARASSANGTHQFIPHEDLDYQNDKKQYFLKADTLFFRVDCFEPNMD